MIKLSKIKIQKKWLILSLLVFVFLIGFWHVSKPLPVGLSVLSEDIFINDTDIDFLYDLTFENEAGDLKYEQEIFNEIYSGIQGAREYILIDMFLFNSWLGNTDEAYKPIASQLTSTLLNQKRKYPDLKIDIISDPINVVYGGDTSDEFNRLRKEGVNVIITNLKPLRDSNAFYSSFWRVFLQWLGNDTWPKWVKHPFSEKDEKVSLRSYLSLLNFKANHRKTFLADSGDSYVSIVSSANPHTSSSAHSNVAVKIEGNAFAKVLLESEKAVANMSDYSLQLDEIKSNKKDDEGLTLNLITEGKIEEALVSLFDESMEGDEVNMAMFYFSNRNIIDSLRRAINRGVSMKLIMDPNKDAFGYEKGGIPNRQVASELVKKTDNKIQIRWYSTHGEQFHSKITYIKRKNGERNIVLGSANLTRRNIGDYNLETNVLINSKEETNFSREIEEYFENIWKNENINYTMDYSVYLDDSFWKKIIYRFQEFSGLSSF